MLKVCLVKNISSLGELLPKKKQLTLEVGTEESDSFGIGGQNFDVIFSKIWFGGYFNIYKKPVDMLPSPVIFIQLGEGCHWA